MRFAIVAVAAALLAAPAAAQEWTSNSVAEVEALLEADPAAGRAMAEALAKTGAPDAINLLGTVIEEQAGDSAEEFARAVAVYEQAVAAGSNKGRINLAMILNFDQERRDYARAMDLAEAASGDPATAAPAAYLLGTGYLFGNGVKQDIPRGVALLSKSIESEPDNDDAQYLLGRAYGEGWGVEPDLPRAWRHHKTAAELGNPRAMWQLGLFFYDGLVVDKDLARAHDWFLRSARGGDPSGQISVAVTLALGEGVAVDAPEARVWYGRAAEQGSAHALRALGMMLITGEGGPVDETTGAAYLELAIEAGDENAPQLAETFRAEIAAQNRARVEAVKKAWRAKYGEPWAD